jgi:hypothetical protein
VRIPPRAVDFDVRGFACCDPAVRQRLERHGLSFAAGFNAAVATPEPRLPGRLEAIAADERGFAFEGAAMALALFDLLLPGRSRRLSGFLSGPAATHIYMAHVGAGWALARLGRRPWSRLRLDPLLRWLALDGYGFHEAFFHPEPVVRRRRVPRQIEPDARPVFDQGVGRALWFVEGAAPDRIARTIGSFDGGRRTDLWSGIGLAAAYAGGVDAAALARVADLAGGARTHLAQGVAFAAKARLSAGNLVPHTELACGLVWSLPADAVAAVTDRALALAGTGRTAADYERWRAAIRAEAPA